jgi:flagellar motor switch protein FliG
MGLPGLRKAAILMVAVGDELAKVLFRACRTRCAAGGGRDCAAGRGAAGATDAGADGVLRAAGDRAVHGARRAGATHRLLAEAFGPARAAELLAETQKMRERTHGDLAMLQKMDPQQLSKFLENEHPQTVALVLAHLDPKRGSTLLMHAGCAAARGDGAAAGGDAAVLAGDGAEGGVILHRRMEALGSNGRRSYAGFKAVADLLNRLDQVSSKTILEQIEGQEPKLAIGIRNLMFTFEDLLTVPEASIRELVAAVDKRLLALALKGAKENLKAHLFKAMSSRAVEMLKDDMESMGPVRTKEVGAAQQEMLVVARHA